MGVLTALSFYFLTIFAPMKLLTFSILVTFLMLSACGGKKTSVTVETDAEQITSADSNAVVAAPDSLDTISVDPGTQSTTMQQDPPKVVAKEKECNPNYTLIGKPAPNQHVYYVTDFNSEEFKCWVLLEEHGAKICNNNICFVYYVDKADLALTKTAPFVDAALLKKHGIARFEHKGKYWEIKGAKTWKRTDKGYGYYNTNNQAGG